MKKTNKKVAKQEVKAKESKAPSKIPQTQKELEAESTRRAGLTPEQRFVEDTRDIKSYDEKVSDYEQHFDNLGMHDPGTKARIAAMKLEHPRVDLTVDDGREPELLARDAVRAAKATELQSGVAGTTGSPGMIPPERKAMNERLSDEMVDRKEHDEVEQLMTEKGIKANMDRGGSEDALVPGKSGKAAVRKY